MRVTVEIPYDYVQGYLKYGHLEYELEFKDDKDFQKFKENPKQYLIDKEENEEEYFDLNDGEFVLDEYSIEDCGELQLNELSWWEI